MKIMMIDIIVIDDEDIEDDNDVDDDNVDIVDDEITTTISSII